MSARPKIYTYKNCGTCLKAMKFLDGRGVEPEELPIRETPPAKGELRKMLKLCGGELKRLFNTSGGDYKALNLKDKLGAMSVEEALDLLSSTGNLVKRPFLLIGNKGAVGFKEDEWSALFG
ncbi:MAG: arsenate reductase family protein [Verrucomicrobiia bacterium]|jgi:arsenate reductase